MTSRNFQFAEGKSNKFWTIELQGASFTVQYGRVGTEGQSQTKDFASEAEAKKAHDKLVAEKIKKGYVEIGAGTASSMSVSRIADAWQRIRGWHKKHEKQLPYEMDFAAAFGVGASEANLLKLESILGLKLPNDFKESYRVHNGSAENGILPYGEYLLSLDEVAQEWQKWCDIVGDEEEEDEEAPPGGPVKEVRWNKKWVPFSHSGSGDHFVVDLDPGRGGKVGQVVKFSHEEGPMRVLAPSLEAWLVNYAHGLEAGEYVLDEGGSLVPVNENKEHEQPSPPITPATAPREFPEIAAAALEQFSAPIAFLKQFLGAMRQLEINCKQRDHKSKKGKISVEEGRKLGLEELRAIFDKYCQCTKKFPVGLCYGDPPGNDPDGSKIISVTEKGKKTVIVIERPASGGKLQYTLHHVVGGYRVSDKVSIFVEHENRFASYSLLL